jgi:hypothetical protein
MHHLTKTIYPLHITPCGYTYDIQDSGDELEIQLIGGIVTGLWETTDIGNMEKILGLLLVYYADVKIFCK